MKWLTERYSLDSFFEEVAQSPKRILITDYDGTLAPFVYDRKRARAYRGVMELLNEIASLPGNELVMVTGRTVEDQRRISPLHDSVDIWGSHGWERSASDGHYEVWPVSEECSQALVEAVEWARELGWRERLETKPACVAVHWRKAGSHEREQIIEMTREKFGDLAQRVGLHIDPFDGGMELLCPGRDKGTAVKTVLEEAGGPAAVCYLGDDSADEQAFSALEDRGLRVLVRTEERETDADLWLRPPREVIRFLQRWRDAVSAG